MNQFVFARPCVHSNDGGWKRTKDMKRSAGKRLSAQGILVSKTLHILVSLSAIALGSFLTVETITAQTPLQKVRIAYSSSGINYVDLFLGKDKGFFREEGLEPQLIQMNSSIAINAAIAGELDGQASIGSAIRAIQRGAPLRVVAAASARLCPPSGAGWMAAGDAAMAVDPLCGNGVGLALRSGMRVAAAILAEEDASGAASAGYDAEVSRAFTEYTAAWRWFYGCERRFPSSEFWRRRRTPDSKAVTRPRSSPSESSRPSRA